MRVHIDPLTRERFRRFRTIRRAWISLWILVVLVGLSLIAELLVNSRAIAVWYQGRLYLPTYDRVRFGDEFGLGYHYEANYRDLARRLSQDHAGWVLLPPVPYDPYEQEFRQGSYPPTLRPGRNGISLERTASAGTSWPGCSTGFGSPSPSPWRSCCSRSWPEPCWGS